jgi:hypothetical protein
MERALDAAREGNVRVRGYHFYMCNNINSNSFVQLGFQFILKGASLEGPTMSKLNSGILRRS